MLHVVWSSYLSKGFPGSSAGKESAFNVETLVRFLGREDPLEKEWPPTEEGSRVSHKGNIVIERLQQRCQVQGPKTGACEE